MQASTELCSETQNLRSAVLLIIVHYLRYLQGVLEELSVQSMHVCAVRLSSPQVVQLLLLLRLALAEPDERKLELFVQQLLIVDLFHSQQHLGTVGLVLFIAS